MSVSSATSTSATCTTSFLISSESNNNEATTAQAVHSIAQTAFAQSTTAASSAASSSASQKALTLESSFDTDGSFGKLLDSKPGLEEVILDRCPNLTDQALTLLSQKLPSLKKLSILHCHSITAAGLEKLPFGRLTHFNLGIDGEIPGSLLEKFNTSTSLEAVCFHFCFGLTAENLSAIKNHIEVNMVGFDPNEEEESGDDFSADDQILPIQPTNHHVSRPTISLPPSIATSSHSSAAMPSSAPTVESSTETLFVKAFSEADSKDPPSINQIPKTTKKAHLSGSIPTAWLESFIAAFPSIEEVHLSDCRNGEIYHIREFKNVRSLSLSNLQVLPRIIDFMFSDRGHLHSSVTHLTISNLPIPDSTFGIIAQFPNLETLHISDCDQLTLQGLLALQNGCEALKNLTIQKCSAMDALAKANFAQSHPLEKLKIEALFDETAVQFLPKPIEDLTKNLRQKYEEFSSLQAASSSSQSSSSIMSLASLDQDLQNYFNVVRIAYALRKELFRTGHFVNNHNPPKTCKMIVNDFILSEKYIKILDFKNLEIISFPLFMTDLGHWKSLETVYLEGTTVSTKIKFLNTFFKLTETETFQETPADSRTFTRSKSQISIPTT